MEKIVTKNIPTDVEIKTSRLTITQIKPCDKQRYFELYTDTKLNALWGYDYNDDLGDSPLTPDFFYNLQNELKETENEYAFAVRLNEQMIGELVLYNPTPDGYVEIGFRFFSEYQGKGYATESAQGLIGYAKNTLGAKGLRGRCFKQNAQSKALFIRLGFKQAYQTETHYHFEFSD